MTVPNMGTVDRPWVRKLLGFESNKSIPEEDPWQVGVNYLTPKLHDNLEWIFYPYEHYIPA